MCISKILTKERRKCSIRIFPPSTEFVYKRDHICINIQCTQTHRYKLNLSAKHSIKTHLLSNASFLKCFYKCFIFQRRPFSFKHGVLETAII